jgi:hypothetical protein
LKFSEALRRVVEELSEAPYFLLLLIGLRTPIRIAKKLILHEILYVIFGKGERST